jgi:predicted transcriptional regulator
LQEIRVIEKLPPRERQVFDALSARGEATAAQLQESIIDGPSNSAVRIMLSRLERKGLVTHRLDGGRFVYAAVLTREKVTQTALDHVVRTLFNGSPLGAAAALIGMTEKVDPSELDRLERLIAEARKQRS